MAVTAGTGGTGTVTTAGGTIFSAVPRESAATSIQVWNDDSSSAACKVQVTGMHDSSATGIHVPVGKTTIVRFGNQGIRECKVFSADPSNAATVHWGVVAMTGAAAM